MDAAAWSSLYERILEDMGYSRQADRDAAEELDVLLADREPVSEERLRLIFQGEHVLVFGGAPHLDEDADLFSSYQGTRVATDGAVQRMVEAGVTPDLIVTDLDKTPKLQVDLNVQEGVPVVVHGHGDNRKQLQEWVPRFEGPVMGTCQCSPEGLERVRNFGGFTDGDRAACLAEHFGARRLLLVGWDFEAATGDKRAKLRWAQRIVEALPIEVDVV